MTEKKRALRALYVSKRLVQLILRDLATAADNPISRRRLGRELAKEDRPASLHASIDAFHALGMGTLTVRLVEPDRLVIEGTDLVEAVPDGATTTCYLSLGFLESAFAMAGGTNVLGTETTCQSKGDSTCTFVIHRQPDRHPRVRHPG